MIKRLFMVPAICFFLSSCSESSEQVKNNEDDFRFFINADPQMGEEDSKNRGIQTLNKLLRLFVAEVNHKDATERKVDFVVYNGDLVHKVKQSAFENFARIVKDQKPPVKLVHGNHDGSMYDDHFEKIQFELAGHRKINYSFSRGQWQFVVIAAQEKYLNKHQSDQQLNWIKAELLKYKDKNVMLFMHYHIMPVGLSQMEFYSYWPDSFKHQIIDAITEHNNVKYVFSGHVHSGIKASIKSSMEYKGTQFIVSPTPVMARPFGEEFSEYETDKKDPFYRRGFYLEVIVDGEDVTLVGHKINHPHNVTYPKNFKVFEPSDDVRFFKQERNLIPDETVDLNFDVDNSSWLKSYRYEKDSNNTFDNVFAQEKNSLLISAPWGAWTFDEYMESYVPIKFESAQDHVINYKFDTPKFYEGGAGGYIRVFTYGDEKKENKQIILYWGSKHNKQKFTYQSLFYHAQGSRINPQFINNKIKSGQIYLKEITFDEQLKSQELTINISAISRYLNGTNEHQNAFHQNYNHVVVGHGVWVSLKKKVQNYTSELIVEKVSSFTRKPNQEALKLNGELLDHEQRDLSNPFFQY